MSTIKERLERIESKLNNIDVTLAVNTEQLKEHIRRTNLLETKLEPVEMHVARVDGALRFLGVVSLLLGIIAAAVKLLGFI